MDNLTGLAYRNDCEIVSDDGRVRLKRLAEILPSTARQVLVVCNPNAGQRSGRHNVEELVSQLETRGMQAQVVTDLDELTTKSTELLARRQLRAIVAAGGDGTAAEVVNRTPPETPLALLPTGTENLLAKYLNNPTAPSEVARWVAEGVTVRLDVALASGRIFLLMISAGFDAEVVRRLDESRQGNISHWSYVKPILAAIRSYSYPELRLYCDDPASGEKATMDQAKVARWAFAFNLPAYAFGMRFTPGASGTDQRLDVCTFQRGSFLAGLKYLIHVLTKRHPRLSDCEIFQCSKLRIESDRPVAYQLDGDPAGQLPVDVEILAGRLQVVTGGQTAERLGFEVPTFND